MDRYLISKERDRDKKTIPPRRDSKPKETKPRETTQNPKRGKKPGD